jgi:hypothetical protein
MTLPYRIGLLLLAVALALATTTALFYRPIGPKSNGGEKYSGNTVRR